MKHPKSLAKEKLVDLIEKIICRLYEDYDGNFDKDREWDSDTLSDVASYLARMGLTPEDSHGKPVYDWSKKVRRARPKKRKEEEKVPIGSAACPVCGSVWLDPDHAASCCEDKRR